MPARAPHVAIAHARIDIGGHLDDCSIDELVVVRRCLERIEVLRAATAAGTAEIGRPWSALDEALRLELTDVRRERDRAERADEIAALDLGEAGA